MQDSMHGENPALSPQDNSRPWYRHFWVWFVLGLLSLSISASLTLVTMAYRHADDVVSDTWYKDGRGVNRDMAAEQMARSLAIDFTVRGVDGKLQASLTSAANLSLPASLTLALRHPTIAARDELYELQLDETGRYQGQGVLPRGRHIATLTPATGHWRLQSDVWVEDGHLRMDTGR